MSDRKFFVICEDWAGAPGVHAFDDIDEAERFIHALVIKGARWRDFTVLNGSRYKLELAQSEKSTTVRIFSE